MSAFALRVSMTDLAEKLQTLRRELRAEYLQPHDWPWIIGFSGGKDSTLILHLVIECLKNIPPDERRRPVFLVCNDTLVESPVYHAFVCRMLERIEDGVGALNVPLQVIRTAPLPEESFWVNLLGRGYPAPNRSFRWCTDRMKIRPTSRFIREQVSHKGHAVLLLGVRRDESARRAQSVAKYHDNLESRLSAHSDHPGCFIYAPIRDFTTEEVWAYLIAASPPWGGSYRDLVALYKEAAGNECPFVLSKSDAPGCGTNSARFGCWTCTVVDKDRSLDALIAGDHQHLEPLGDFRKRLKSVSEEPDCRSKTRRNGMPGLGPLTMETRRTLLDELLAVQASVGTELISSLEVRLIREQWLQDEATAEMRKLARLSLNEEDFTETLP
jgi:DNA sulfur modification protein DndC